MDENYWNDEKTKPQFLKLQETFSTSVKLYTSTEERALIDNCSNLYSIFATTELLEQLYTKGTIESNDYSQQCSQLITQYRTSVQLLEFDKRSQQHLQDAQSDSNNNNDSDKKHRSPYNNRYNSLHQSKSSKESSHNHESHFQMSLEEFIREYRISRQFPAAIRRLVEIGIPATTEHLVSSVIPGDGLISSSNNNNNNSNNNNTGNNLTGTNLKSQTSFSTSKYVAEIVQSFITILDMLKLNMTAVDQLHPLLTDLVRSLNKITGIIIKDPKWIWKEKIKDWMIKLNKMRASEELDKDQVRQLSFDLESAHNEFHRLLE